MESIYIGVDVGSGSVRAGLFNSTGVLQHVAVRDIKVNNPEPGYYEQSSEDIWTCVCYVVKEVTKNVDEQKIEGISFCATCSLVAIGDKDEPVSISKNGDKEWNIVMWMDHRAEKEGAFINTTGHEVLEYVGGSISLEMETPKILWLKHNLPSSFENTKHYFDLGDFLRWKATGSLKRSICCIVCKWTYLNDPSKNEWSRSYFEKIGLEDALPKIGEKVSFPGDADVISITAAENLQLPRNLRVGFSMIDAHSGVLGMIGCHDRSSPSDLSPSTRLGLISGTSNCHMALSTKCVKVPGVWGPYYGVILKDMYLSEGGQSAAGKLLDHIVMSHPAYFAIQNELGSHGKVLSKLEDIILNMVRDGKSISELTNDLHIWPDFHGNRSPVADPTLKGMICGLTLSTSRENLAILYLATIQALAYGSRHIKESMEKSGHHFEELVICGGLTKSNLFLVTHADAIGLPVVTPDCSEPVLLGAAISAAAACKPNAKLTDVLKTMAGNCSKVNPNFQDKSFHDKKYKVFLSMLEDQKKYRKIMSGNE